MQTTLKYKKWDILPGADTVGAIRTAAVTEAGGIIASGSGNLNQEPPTHATQGDIPVSFSVPYAVDDEGNQISMQARVEISLNVEDWGYAELDGNRLISMTSSDEPPGPLGGHSEWGTQTASAVVSSGEHEILFHYENIEMSNPNNNKLVCDYSWRVVAMEAGGTKEADPCGCGGSTSSMQGGIPNSSSARSVVSGLNTSSAGSEVSATITEDSMYWSCNVGTLRGLGALLVGKLVLQAKQLDAVLATPAALLFNHPMAAVLQLPEEGVIPGCRMEIQRGNRVIALRYYTDGSVTPVGVDSAGLGMADILPAEADTPASLRWQEESGATWRFSLEDGTLMSYISPDGVRVANVSEYLAVRRVNGVLHQLWSFWDGLIQVENVSESGYTLVLYAPDQVSEADSDGQFQLVAGAEPFKSFVFAWDGNTLSVTERSRHSNEIVTTWQQNTSGAWVMTHGTGTEASTTTQIRTVLEPASPTTMEVWQQITTVSRNGSVASCTCEVYQNTPVGQLLLTRVEGYGSPGALTTTYEYDGNGNEIRRTAPDGSVLKSYYDSTGRLVKTCEPWHAGDYELITDYHYENSTAGQFNGELSLLMRKLRPIAGGLMTTLTSEYHSYSQSEGIKREVINTYATGSQAVHTEIIETWNGDASDLLNRGRLRMRQEVNEVQKWYDYAVTSQYGAIYSITEETRVADNPVPGQSRRRISFIDAAGNTIREEEYILLSDAATWALLSGVSHTYDVQNHRIASLHDNGRAFSREVNCNGDPLWEENEDGIRTFYTYDSARRLVETTRDEVSDGNLLITPETITEYVHDAENRIIRTITHTGPMQTVSQKVYDTTGRQVIETDTLGRITTTSYSIDGLTTTVKNPAGATTITTRHADGALAHISGTAQQEVFYTYTIQNELICEIHSLMDGTILYKSSTNGFGETMMQAKPNSLGGFIYTRHEYNARGQLVQTWNDTGMDSEPVASTLFEYDSMGNVVKKTLALADVPTPENSPVALISYGAENQADGVYSTTTITRYNADAQPLVSTQMVLISRLSSTLEEKVISVNERGLTSSQWSEYSGGTKRMQYSTVPTSSITAETLTVDGFVVSQKDHTGICTTSSRSYAVTGMQLVHTDGRGNATTTVSDIAGRSICVTDAAGFTTTTAYDEHFDKPSIITDAQGNTTCYRYDVRGRKVAEWGIAVQPACFGYDEADRLVSLKTFRAGTETIGSDPTVRTDADETTWSYDAATGLELSKTYADNSSVVKTYDAFNRLASETDARGKMKQYSYDYARGLLLGTTYSDTTTPRSYTYNHMGQLTQMTDAAGTRTLSYNTYGELESDSLLAGGKIYLITETRDTLGRSTGYTYAKNGTTLQTVTTGYGADGRINNAGFLHGSAAKQFSYEYLPGTNLLQKLTLPSNMTLTQEYEPQRNLLTSMHYKRSNTSLVQRTYSYDMLGRPLTRSTARNRQTINDSFGYNTRSELTSATVNNAAYAYEYDNIGNRKTAQENSEEITSYQCNVLNQYTALSVDDFTDFIPTYDADGNQIRVKTCTGIWSITYDAENRPTEFTKIDSSGSMTIHCEYDSMGRRATKQVTVNGSVTLHQRYLYRGYLQIACVDLTRGNHPELWFITWDPTQAIATRPLAIQLNGTWYTYGWDLTKNICEVYGPSGYIRTAYTYAPYGEVSAEGDVTQPIQWSSEYHDSELGLVYYNYRHYNPVDGRWIGRDKESEMVCRYSLYNFLHQSPTLHVDALGLNMIDTICDHNIKMRQVEKEYMNCTKRCVNQRTREIYDALEFHDRASGANSSIGGPNVGERESAIQGAFVILALISTVIQYKLCMDECKKNYRKNKPNLQLCI